MKHVLPRLLCLLCLVPFGAAQAAGTPHYRITHQVPLPGDEGWDYLLFDQAGHRLFVSHGSRVVVLDADKLTVTGEIPDTPGVHGIALAPDLGRGFVSAGRSNSVVVFDLKTLARLKEIKVTGENPDAILYDPATHRVLTFNGRGRNVTAIDAKTDEVVGTVAVDAKPEFAATDGKGRVYVNLEDKNSLAVLDPQKVTVVSTWPLPGCEEPSGLALDAAHGRLIPVCGNKVMAVVDGASGQVLGTVPIGGGVDAAAFDPDTGLAFASCGEGVLTVVHIGSSGRPEVAQSATTQRGARTMALDLEKHRVFLVTADFSAPPPPTAAQPHPRPAIVPGSVRLLVLESDS
jgi:DNA-binding beta-propeller fold protein YncE